MHYYTLSEGADRAGGPFTADQMLSQYAAGAIDGDTLAAAAGDSFWQSFSSLLPVIEADAEQMRYDGDTSDTAALVQDVLETGPPTTPLLLKLLREDGYVHPVPRRRPYPRP